MKPNTLFRPGKNIAIKVPTHEFSDTVAFYRDVLGLSVLDEERGPSVVFEFGGKKLWIDNVPAMSQAEIWLEVTASDIDAAAKHLGDHGVVRRDEIEPLPDGMAAFWVTTRAGIIHLVSGE